MCSLATHPALHAAINHMCIIQGVTNIGGVRFYKFVGLILSQATIVDSQTSKKDTRKINAATTGGGHGHGFGRARDGKGQGGGRGCVEVDVMDLMTPTDHSFLEINGMSLLV
jgi:hypothetical protein